MIARELKEASQKVIGINEVERAVKKGIAAKVYIAQDADEEIKDSVMILCLEHGVDTKEVSNMADLGKAAGITVRSTMACVLKCEK